MSTASLYQTVVGITEDYLGPVAERFINRQIENHLQKSPEDLRKKDLPVLIDWIRLSVSALTDDKKLIEEYTKRLERFSQNPERLQ